MTNKLNVRATVLSSICILAIMAVVFALLLFAGWLAMNPELSKSIIGVFLFGLGLWLVISSMINLFKSFYKKFSR